MQGPIDQDTAAGARPASNSHVHAASSPSLRRCAWTLLGRAVAAATTLGAASVASVAAILSFPSVAHAQPAASTSIAVLVEGPDAQEVREDILSLVPETLKVISPEAFSKALQGAGQSKPVGTVILSRRNRVKVLYRLRKAAATVKAAAVVFGLVRTNRARKKEVYVVLIDQASGDLVLDGGVPMTGSPDDHHKALDRALAGPFAALAPKGKAGDPKSVDPRSGGPKSDDPKSGDEKPASDESDAAPPPEGDDAETPESTDEEPPTSERKPHEIASALAEVELSVEIVGRWFDYSDGVTNNLRPYDVFGPPMISLSAEVYPLAGTGISVLKGLGLTGGVGRVFGLSSSVSGGDKITTTYQRVHGGLRLRLPFSDGASPSVVGISGGIRLLTFSFDAPDDLVDEAPEVAYTLLRSGLDVHIPLGPTALVLAGEHLVPLSSGDVYDRFTDASVTGIGVSGGVTVPITGGFEARLMAEYTRFFSSFKVAKGEPYIAGGALDQYLGLRLAGAYVY